MERPVSWVQRFWSPTTALELAALVGLTCVLFFYGLVPLFGGAGLGLVGADEPRYAQVAREMLARHDYVTPVLYGKPWLEKPALYYWRAMFAFKEFGVSDWSARLPSGTFAFTLIVLIYLHMKRFRPGGHLDAALLTASCAGILSFARGASTDMQLAAPFGIGMLGWYAWYETDSKFWLFDLYFFIGAATLAKGPVAPFLALLIIVAFAALRREWTVLRRTFWWPGAVLYLLMVLPWFIAVQRRNPNFLRVFFLEHNLERFATNRFEHEQSIGYYLPVVLLSLMPWAVLAVAALVSAIRASVAEWRARRAKGHYRGYQRAGDAFPEFLVIWAILPILFFSTSDSKLPGYILPSIPPLTILTGDYLNRQRSKGLSPWLLGGHALLAGLLTTFILLAPAYLMAGGFEMPGRVVLAAGMAGFGSALLILITVGRFGLQRLRTATMVPLLVLLLFIFGIGPVFGVPALAASKRTIHLLDATYSPRLLAAELKQLPPAAGPVAVFQVRRDVEYGLSFYRNQRVLNYDRSGVPEERHILISREPFVRELPMRLGNRHYEVLFTLPEQGLIVYAVDARTP
ncbi:phospholipid carrier-dependent glycosyltransferase [Acidipila sp. EB88]|nr:phospholipid carrier-dependent glycosyltransferase [Acidipila sp. EB88]